MSTSIIVEGKTTTEAIEIGLSKLKLNKNQVDVKVIESTEKRSFFSILAPRVVKVELTVKENIESKENHTEIAKREFKRKDISEDDKEKAIANINKFFSEIKIEESINIDIIDEKTCIKVDVTSENIGFLIGYRGETLYAMEEILNSVANKNTQNRVKVILDIEKYKLKREKTLENLAEKISKEVLKTKKSVKLEPMQAYERKIIHSKLQNDARFDTTSVGEEPYRRIVVSLK